MYELHDGKMLYLLTQHSLFNRKHKSFLLCSCGRGEGVRNRNHKCTILTDIEQQQWCNRSKRRWDLKRPIRNKYGKKEHMDWVDEHNNGISHFGFSPSIFPRSSIRFDVFHLRGAVTRRLMSNLRTFRLGSTMNIDLAERFSDVLGSFWTEYNVLLWNLNKASSK